MKKITSFLFFACIASGLIAQSWRSPNLDDLQESYHDRTIIDFQLKVDESDYASPAGDPIVAAFIGGECRGESNAEVIYMEDGTTISYHTLTVYGDLATEEGEEISFRFMDMSSGIEYILPQKFTFDGEHHGYPSDLETLSFTSVREIFLSNQTIYPNGEFNLNEYMTLQGEYTEVYDGTQIVVIWSIGDGGGLPEGFDLNPETGILTTSENAVPGKVNYSVIASGSMSATGTLTLEYSVADIQILKEEIEVPVGSNINQYVIAGDVYNVLPAAANQNVTITAADANIVDARGNVLAKGSTTLTIASVENPAIERTLILKAYIPLTGFELREGDMIYENYENIFMDRQSKKTLALYPVPAGARIDTELLDIYTYSTRENLYADFPHYKVEVENIVIEHNESDEFEYATFTLHGWSIGCEDLIITYGTEDNVEYGYWYLVNVGADFQLTDGWDWVTINDSWFPENNSFNYLNGADYFGGGLIDVRSKTGNLYKDPVYGIYGSIAYMNNSTCYKMKFDRSQATGLADDATYFVSYPQKYESGVNTMISLSKGWNWLAYPFEYDYEFAELEPYFNEYDGENGDIILAADGSMVTYSASAGWVVPDEGFTFHYGKGYLYYTTSDRRQGLYWGDVNVLPQVDFTVTVEQTPNRNRESVYWEYDPHRFPNKMPIIARLEGIDNPSNYTIGAFVGDECRGEGKAAKQWMFITVNGEANELITFRLIDKLTGICYDLSESLTFDSMAGSLDEPVCFNAPAVTGIENMTSNKLIIQGDVVTGPGIVQIYDVQGKVIAEGYERIDMSQLGKGIYVVKSGKDSRKVVK